MVAIVLHYVCMSAFAWTFVESLHLYRMLTEPRNIDAGPMRFYYVVGWGIPAIVTGEGALGPPPRLPPAQPPPPPRRPQPRTPIGSQGRDHSAPATGPVCCCVGARESWVWVSSGFGPSLRPTDVPCLPAAWMGARWVVGWAGGWMSDRWMGGWAGGWLAGQVGG